MVPRHTMRGRHPRRHFRKLGVRPTASLRCGSPKGLDFTALFHGVDERVPVDALEFGARFIDRFLDQV